MTILQMNGHAERDRRRDAFTHAQNFAALILGRVPLGHIYFVDSNNGASGADGLLPEAPLDSYATALSRIAEAASLQGYIADNVIFGLPGHNEAVAAASSISGSTVTGVHFSDAGTLIRQLGKGASAAKITLTTAVTADINFDATDCYIEGGKIVAGLDNLTAPIDYNEDRVGLRGVELELGSGVTDAPTDWIACGAAKDRMEFSGCRFEDTETGSTSLISITAAATNFILTDNDIRGDFSTAVVNNTTAAYANLRNHGNRLENTNAASLNFVRFAGATEIQLIDGEEWNFVSNVVAMDATGASEVNEHEVFTVTGDVDVKLLNRITETVTSGGSLTAVFGISGDTDQFIGSTAVAGLVAGLFWNATTPTGSGVPIEKRITGGKDIGYELGTDTGTDGTIEFMCWWRPAPGNGGKVVAATVAAGAI